MKSLFSLGIAPFIALVVIASGYGIFSSDSVRKILACDWSVYCFVALPLVALVFHAVVIAADLLFPPRDDV